MITKTLQKPLSSDHAIESHKKTITNPTFIKWAGGKTQLLSKFEKLYPLYFNRFFEPFIGSGAVFFYLKQLYPEKEMFLSDNNSELINCYEIVKNDLEQLIELLKEHRSKHNKEYYYSIRNMEITDLSNVELAARFIYLNKTCFNGLYRVNSKGKFNVPIGGYKNPRIFKESDLRNAKELLQGVELKTMPFEELINIAQKNDFIYLDPPYHPLSQTSSFTSYTRTSFTEDDQVRLAEVYRQLDKKGCLLMLSNSYCDFILDLYDGYRIEQVSAKRMINCNGKKRGAVDEAVVINY
ncbi:MAG: DNA adenine methylase [Candidatus Methanoperedens sp.]|nr:DNA adenine methylase [Candidatus Methanoperedens sp.]